MLAASRKRMVAGVAYAVSLLQNVLQFQSRGTLMACGVCAKLLASLGSAEDASIGLVGVGVRAASVDSVLDDWLLARLRHSLKSEKQCWQALLKAPRGL